MAKLEQALKLMINNAVEYNKPCEIYAGEVKTVSPLTILLNINVPVLEEDELILTHLVKDYDVDISVSHETEEFELVEGAMTDIKKHKHEYKGRKKITIHNGLKVGEGVLLIRQQGGQKFIVLDRIENPQTEGEWL